ncbi:2-oxoacid:acceptor oxidoreductase family protein [Candidatus Bathyarchaeota archaeon]|nr:2-oxoacid:acceptor oxidoreductase family protein [Candidatus Bathyarchaeota archaeon]
MKIEIRIVGFGGQGVILAGQILGKAAVIDGKNAVQTQTYGAEARGSATKSEVIISDDKIGFPLVRKCDIQIAMNQEAVDKNIMDLKENGTILVDSSNVTNIPETKATVVKIPATQIAETSCGERLYANIVMLGALTKATKIVSEKSMEKAIENSVPKKAAATNLLAFKKGLED